MSTPEAVGTFPAWFPPGCPPEDAMDAAGVIFRFVSHDPPSPDDFLSHEEMEFRGGETPVLHHSKCNRCSLSVYDSLVSAKATLKKLKENHKARTGLAYRYSAIAKGELSAELGKMKQTGKDPSHHDWWPYVGISRHDRFSVVARMDQTG